MTEGHGRLDAENDWGSSREMGELEATMWRAGRHPQNSTQGAVLEIFDGTPAWSDVLRLHHDGLDRYPRFMQRVVEPALPIGPPAWVHDSTFDLDDHLSRIRLPAPGDTRQLLDTAQELAREALDPARPQWKSTFIEGLEGGRSAYLVVVHHVLMDGNGSVALLSDLHGRTKAVAFKPVPIAIDSTDPVRLAVDQAATRLRSLPRFTSRAVSTAVDILRDGPAKATRFAVSAGRVLAPPQGGASELLTGGSRRNWRYEALDFPLADLKAAGKAAGGTVNDVYVAGIIGGLRIYHEKSGSPIGDITINMPVSLRRPDEPAGGNRFVTAFLKAPSSVSDPTERVARLRRAVNELGSEPALDFFGLLLPVVNRAPAALLAPLFNSLQDRTDLTISNVAGMRSAVKFGGCTVEGIYYFGPLPGCHITTVLSSYKGMCNIGINCDEDVFGKSDELRTCLVAGMEEVLDLRHG